jgi:hypothetical protein
MSYIDDQFQIRSSGVDFGVTITAGYTPETLGSVPRFVAEQRIQLAANSTLYIYILVDTGVAVAATALRGSHDADRVYIGTVVTGSSGVTSVTQPMTFAWPNGQDLPTKSVKVRAVAGAGNIAPLVTNTYDATSRTWTYQVRIDFPQATCRVSFLFSHLQGSSGYIASLAGTSVDIKASVMLVSGDIIPITFNNGTRTFTMQDGTLIESDVLGLSFAAGSYCYVRTRLSNPVGGGIVGLSRPSITQTARTEGYASTDVVDSGTITAGKIYAYGPCAVLGDIDPVDRDGVAILGTSIEWGAYDFGGSNGGYGYLPQAFGSTIPYVNLAVPGKAAYQTVDERTGNHHIWRLVGLCRDAVMQFTVNDLAGGRTLSQAQADWLTIVGKLRAAGIRKVIGCTTVPRTTADTTSLWSTLAGQTVVSTESDRVAFNAWLLAGVGTGCDAVWNVAAAVADATATTKWSVDPTPFLDTTITGSSSTTSAIYCTASPATGTCDGKVVWIGPDPASASVVVGNTLGVMSLRFALGSAPTAGTRVRIMNTRTYDGVHPSGPGITLMAAACNLSDLA